MNTILLLILKCKLPAEGDYTGRNEHPSHPLRPPPPHTRIFLQVLTGHWKRTQGPYAPGRRTAAPVRECRSRICRVGITYHIWILSDSWASWKTRSTICNSLFHLQLALSHQEPVAGRCYCCCVRYRLFSRDQLLPVSCVVVAFWQS